MCPHRIQRRSLQSNSLHIEYDWCYIKPFDCFDISTENDSFFCYPKKTDVVTKLAFATEIIYGMHRDEKTKKRAQKMGCTLTRDEIQPHRG